MEISVIIPTYKPQTYLWECLDSLCTQTIEKSAFEVVIVLNGCSDPYDADITNYINNHPNINWRYVQTDQGGVSNARNIALDIAKGDFVTFMDDDDYVSPTYLEALLKAADDKTISIARPYAFNDGHAETPVKYPLSDIFDNLDKDQLYDPSKVRRFFSGPCMKLIPMSFIQGRKFDTTFSIGEDGLFMFLISNKFRCCRITTPDALYYRRYREGSLLTSGRTKKQARNNSWRMLKTMVGYYLSDIFHYNVKYTAIQMASVIKSIIKPSVIKSNQG